jgi:glutathione peroxidase
MSTGRTPSRCSRTSAPRRPGTFGPESGRLWEHISKNRPEMIGTDDVKWNYTKFLIGPDGQVVGRYEPTVTPEEIRADLDALLGAHS